MKLNNFSGERTDTTAAAKKLLEWMLHAVDCWFTDAWLEHKFAHSFSVRIVNKQWKMVLSISYQISLEERFKMQKDIAAERVFMEKFKCQVPDEQGMSMFYFLCTHTQMNAIITFIWNTTYHELSVKRCSMLHEWVIYKPMYELNFTSLPVMIYKIVFIT